MRSDKMFTFPPTTDKTVYNPFLTGYAPVIHGNRETFVFHIECKVLTHDGKPDQSYICFHILLVSFSSFYFLLKEHFFLPNCFQQI